MICFQKQNRGLNRPGVYRSKLGARNIGRYAKQCPTILIKTEVGVEKKKGKTYIVFLIGFKVGEACGNTRSDVIQKTTLALAGMPQLVGASITLCNKRWQVLFPLRAHTWVSGLIPVEVESN